MQGWMMEGDRMERGRRESRNGGRQGQREEERKKRVSETLPTVTLPTPVDTIKQRKYVQERANEL